MEKPTRTTPPRTVVIPEGTPVKLVQLEDGSSALGLVGGGFIRVDTRPEAEADPLARYSGPTKNIGASIPKELADEVRARVGQVGQREFSRFVARALARELIDMNRIEFIEAAEAEHGPVDPEALAQFEQLFSR